MGSLLLGSFIRHVAPVVVVYISSERFQEQVAVAVTASVAFLWSAIEKKGKK